jgi:hypothetical protein
VVTEPEAMVPVPEVVAALLPSTAEALRTL